MYQAAIIAPSGAFENVWLTIEEVDSWVIAAGYKVGEQLVDDGLTYSERYFNLDEAKSELSEGSNGYKVYGINSDEIIVVEVTEWL